MTGIKQRDAVCFTWIEQTLTVNRDNRHQIRIYSPCSTPPPDDQAHYKYLYLNVYIDTITITTILSCPERDERWLEGVNNPFDNPADAHFYPSRRRECGCGCST